MYKYAFAVGISVFALAMIANRDLAVTEPAVSVSEFVVERVVPAAATNEASMQNAVAQNAADATEVDRNGSWRQWPSLTDF